MSDIRLATGEDVSAIETVVRAAYEPWAERIGVRPMPMDADYVELVQRGLVYVVGDAVDGLLVIADEPQATVVDNVAVRPDAQHRGIGRRLMSYALDRARDKGLASARLYTHSLMTDNIAWYASMGFEETFREPMGVGERVHMAKDLGT